MGRWGKGWTTVIFWLLTACGGSHAGSGARVGVLQEAGGTARIHAWSEAGALPDLAEDLHDTLIQGLVESEAGAQVVPGYGRADGTFSIPGLPDGPYWLRVGSSYFWTDRRSVDLGTWTPGRRDQFPGSSGTAVRLRVDGLNPWGQGAALEWMVPNQGLAVGLNGLLQDAPPPGATSLETRLAWSGLPLLDATRGDRAFLVQVGSKFLPGGESLSVVEKVLRIEGARFTDGGSTPVMGTLTMPPRKGVRVAWRRSAFTGLADAIHPGAFAYAQSFQVAAHPLDLSHGWVGGTASILGYVPTAFGVADPDLGVVETGQPYPSDWVLSHVDHSFVAPFQAEDLPGGRAGVLGRMGVVIQGLPSPGSFAAPLVTPLQNVTVGGQGAFGPIKGAGREPRIAWEAPASGRVDGVWIQVGELRVQGGGGYLLEVANLYVSGESSVILPPYLLKEGHRYQLRLRAYRMDALDYRREPFRRSLPYGYADVITELIEP